MLEFEGEEEEKKGSKKVEKKSLAATVAKQAIKRTV